MLKKVLGYALIAFIVFFIINNPAGAAESTKEILAGLEDAGTAFGDFLTRVSQ